MTSEKQIAANRENAKRSTGPNTVEGKSRSRLNAKRDGITGQVVTLSEEDLPVFEKFRAGLIADLNPKTLMETNLASSIAWDTWRLNHLRAVEMNIYALGAENPEIAVDSGSPHIRTAMSNALTFEQESKKFALMSLYEQRLNRGIHKNLEELKKLQAERKRQYEQDRTIEVTIAQANDIKGLPYYAPSRPSENGFVFSTAEILAQANRNTVAWDALATRGGAKDRIQFPGAWENFNPRRPDSGLTAAAAA